MQANPTNQTYPIVAGIRCGLKPNTTLDIRSTDLMQANPTNQTYPIVADTECSVRRAGTPRPGRDPGMTQMLFRAPFGYAGVRRGPRGNYGVLSNTLR